MHYEKYTANLSSEKMLNQRRKKPGITAAVVGSKCEKILHHPGHDVPKKADDEPALLPLLTTKFNVKVNFVGDPWPSGRRFNRNRGRRCSCLAVVHHCWQRIKEVGDDNDHSGCRGNGS